MLKGCYGCRDSAVKGRTIVHNGIHLLMTMSCQALLPPLLVFSAEMGLAQLQQLRKDALHYWCQVGMQLMQGEFILWNPTRSYPRDSQGWYFSSPSMLGGFLEGVEAWKSGVTSEHLGVRNAACCIVGSGSFNLRYIMQHHAASHWPSNPINGDINDRLYHAGSPTCKHKNLVN